MSGDGAVVRLVDRPRSAGRRTVVVSWQAPGRVPREASVEVDVAVDAGVAEKLRWYLEDYGEFPADPAPVIAAETERMIAGLGRELFAAVFGSGDAATLWAQASLGGVGGLRVEVDADPSDVPGLPWELLRDPATDRPLVVAAGQFVRTHREAASTVEVPGVNRESLRVLLVICRPEGREDVAFRSVASRLVRGGADRLPGLDLQVLRPATFPRLRQVLSEAREQGRPFHVVHFDGHGTYLDVDHLDLDTDTDLAPDGSAAEGARAGMTGGSGGGDGVAVSPLRYGIGLAAPARPGRHGYLVFEKPGSGANQQLVDGPTLAGSLVEAGVPVLVLNACRSAYAEAPTTPDTDTPDTDAPDADAPEAAGTRAGVHDRIRAYGSLAAEVADAGVPGVVAMRYNVYVVTAAQFVADLYAHLVAGRSLGVAATEARKALAADPTREIGAAPVALQDWVVPTVYEPLPLTLAAPAPADTGAPLIRLQTPEQRHAEQTGLAAGGVPEGPDVGFFGRDETLLALDRAFDEQQVVLLWALAGAGKTTTAAEFARWYAATGGLADPQVGSGPVVWTTFEHHLPLARVLDQVAAACAPQLQASGIDWATVTDPPVRRDYVLQLLAAVPLLWVWDNVEPVAGFPEGTRSAWSDTEQQELLGFLRELKTRTRAKVLLTSRRPEHRWLGAVPVRVGLPPMPMRERRQLAHALVRHLAPDTPPDGWEAVDWRALLRFTGGNPLTITVAVRQALRDHVTNTAEVEAFVARVQAGAGSLEQADDAEQGRERSLAASLAYGFDRAFTDRERAVLAVLHLFRDTVDVDALRMMGHPDTAETDAVSALAGTDRDGLIGLLDRAVEVGLVTGYGGGYYGVHPALPWFFTGLFTEHLGPPASGAAAAAERTYARAYRALGDYYAARVEAGRAAEVLAVLRVEEANLLHGLELARTHQLPEVGVGCLQGLRQLYRLTGRDEEWARLVGEIEGDYLDPDTDQPLPGRDDQYSIVTSYRIQVARARRDWPTATRLHTALTAWDRARAAPYLDLPADRLNATARYRLRDLAVDEQDLGNLLSEQDDPACLDHYRAAYDLADKLGDTGVQANQASNLGDAYLFVPGVRDLDQAQHWHQRGLDLTPEEDRIGRAASHISLASVAYNRFLDARATGAKPRWYRRFGPFKRSVPDTKLHTYLDAAVAGNEQALQLLPADHHDYRATAHNQLGNVYTDVGDVPQALRHYEQALHHTEARGATYTAGQIRYNIALLYTDDGRPGDALLYARAAVANFRDVGPGAATTAKKAQALINRLERAAGG